MNTDLIIREPDLYFDSLHQELNNFLRDTFFHSNFANPLVVKKNSVWRPAIEFKQDDKNYKIKVQLPGVKKDDIEIELNQDYLTINAKIEEETENKDDKMQACEFKYGQYKRTMSFDTPIKIEDAEAKYENGILCMKLPKQEIEQQKTKKLTIK